MRSPPHKRKGYKGSGRISSMLANPLGSQSAGTDGSGVISLSSVDTIPEDVSRCGYNEGWGKAPLVVKKVR
jgi:hypothetical protein